MGRPTVNYSTVKNTRFLRLGKWQVLINMVFWMAVVLLLLSFARGSNSDGEPTLYWTMDISDNQQSRIYFHGEDPELFLEKLFRGDGPLDTKFSQFDSHMATFGAIATDNGHPRSVFVHNLVDGAIYRYTQHNHRVENIAEGTSPQVVDLAVDWVSENLYFTDPTLGVAIIHYGSVFPLRATLIIPKSGSLGGIDVDPILGLLFYVDQDRGSVIQTTLTGDQETVIINHGYPTYIAADTQSHTLYWLDELGDTLSAYDYVNKKNEVVWYARPGQIETVSGIEAYKNYVYLSTWENNNITVIQNSWLTSVRQFHTSLFHDVSACGIAISAPDRQPRLTSMCDDRGGCDHICVSEVSSGRRCLCAFGYKLDVDGHTCFTGGQAASDTI